MPGEAPGRVGYGSNRTFPVWRHPGQDTQIFMWDHTSSSRPQEDWCCGALFTDEETEARSVKPWSG